MSFANLARQFRAGLRRRWAGFLASDPNAGLAFAPEFPAATFARSKEPPPLRAVQTSGTAARQRSASISTNNG